MLSLALQGGLPLAAFERLCLPARARAALEWPQPAARHSPGCAAGPDLGGVRGVAGARVGGPPSSLSAQLAVAFPGQAEAGTRKGAASAAAAVALPDALGGAFSVPLRPNASPEGFGGSGDRERGGKRLRAAATGERTGERSEGLGLGSGSDKGQAAAGGEAAQGAPLGGGGGPSGAALADGKRDEAALSLNWMHVWTQR